MRGFRWGCVYLTFMSFSRTTHNGRRITATARVREQPDTKRLVALVLHLADQLHADELTQQRASNARDDHQSARDEQAEEGTNDDAPTAHSASTG